MGNSMNEKIKELLPNPFAVDYTTYDEPMDLYREQELEKFAVKLIEKCFEICRDNLLTEPYDFTYNDGVIDCSLMIKQHFGVE